MKISEERYLLFHYGDENSETHVRYLWASGRAVAVSSSGKWDRLSKECLGKEEICSCKNKPSSLPWKQQGHLYFEVCSLQSYLKYTNMMS